MRRMLVFLAVGSFVILAAALLLVGVFLLAGSDDFAGSDDAVHPGQQLVHGRILAHDTGQPIAGATVTAVSRELFNPNVDRDKARTNANGEFSLHIFPKRWMSYEIRAAGYMPVDLIPELKPFPSFEMVRATAEPSDLVTPLVHIPPGTRSFKLDMPAGRLVQGDDYDVAVSIDPEVDSMVVVEAGPGRGLQVEKPGPWLGCGISFPANLQWAPVDGYGRSARVPRRSGPLLCFVRRERGPTYGALDLFPRAYFPATPYADGWNFDVVWNRKGERGFCGSERMIFE